MFTIFGATGNTGVVVASELLTRGQKVRVVARTPEKVASLRERGAEIFQGDVEEPASIRDAFAGAEGAYLLLPPGPSSREPIARAARITDAFVAALRAHPVNHAVLLSSVAAHLPSGTGPIVTAHHAEKALGAVTTTTFTFLRAAFFMENLLASAHPIAHDGVLPVFGGDEATAFPMVATADIGRAAAEALLNPPAASAILELSGPQEYSYVDAASDAAAILGRPVKASAVPLEALVPTMMGFGLSAEFAELYREMTEARAKGRIVFDGAGRAVRGATPLRDVLAKLRG